MPNKKKTPKQIINKMLDDDAYSQWLGIHVVEVEPGSVVLEMKVRKEMLNGYGMCHGGILSSFADTALAFAARSRDKVGITIENNISFLTPVKQGDVLRAETEELTLTEKTGVYNVNITKRGSTKVAIFRGTVYRKSKKNSKEDA